MNTALRRGPLPRLSLVASARGDLLVVVDALRVHRPPVGAGDTAVGYMTVRVGNVAAGHDDRVLAPLDLRIPAATAQLRGLLIEGTFLVVRGVAEGYPQSSETLQMYSNAWQVPPSRVASVVTL